MPGLAVTKSTNQQQQPTSAVIKGGWFLVIVNYLLITISLRLWYPTTSTTKSLVTVAVGAITLAAPGFLPSPSAAPGRSSTSSICISGCRRSILRVGGVPPHLSNVLGWPVRHERWWVNTAVVGRLLGDSIVKLKSRDTVKRDWCSKDRRTSFCNFQELIKLIWCYMRAWRLLAESSKHILVNVSSMSKVSQHSGIGEYVLQRFAKVWNSSPPGQPVCHEPPLS